MNHGQHEGSCLAAACARHANHIQSLHNEWHGSALDGRGQAVALALYGAQHVRYEAHGICRGGEVAMTHKGMVWLAAGRLAVG
jgi:hypothetical protein